MLETLRGDARMAHVPFVFLTGWGEREDLRAGKAAAAAPKRAGAAAEQRPEQLEPLGLTPREAEILFWVARGKTNHEIATVLGIGLTTVKKHLESTYAKLGAENRTTAAAMALEQLAAG